MAQSLILDRYKPIRQAGVGGFGTVVVAWDGRIQRNVAIKVIALTDADAARAGLPGNVRPLQSTIRIQGVSTQETAGPTGIAGNGVSATWSHAGMDAVGAGAGLAEGEGRHWLADIPGLDEARTAAMLQDQNIVSVYDFEVRGSQAYLIMEYVEGLTLKDLLRDHSADLTLDAITAVFMGVAHALEAAHKRKVLHLDIKPANILINEEGQVKVADFGLATLADAQGGGKAGGGTIGYMPLEQIRRERLDARTDEWALASIMYEMLSGRNPFVVPELEAAQAAIEDAELVLPSAFWDDMDPAIDDVIFDALGLCPEERFETVKDFRQRLAPFLGNAKAGTRDLAELVCEERRRVSEDADAGADEDVDEGDARGFGNAAVGGAIRTRFQRALNMVLRIVGALFACAMAVFLLINGHFAAGAVFLVVAVLWWLAVTYVPRWIE